MKCVKVGDIPNPVYGTCSTCKTEWEASRDEVRIGILVPCRLCYSGKIIFQSQPVYGSGYVAVSQKNGPTRHYFDGVELTFGIYRIHWTADPENPSFASVMMGMDGAVWVAVVNWCNVVTIDRVFSDDKVSRIENITEKISKI